jgi:FG-GAP repeat
MLPSRSLAATGFACLALSAAAAVSHAQDTPIFIEDQKILASDGAAGDHLGRLGSSGLHNDLLIVGAPRVDGPSGEDSGAAYIFRFNGSEWVQETKLEPADGTVDGYFGKSVAIHTDFAVVGCYKDADPSNYKGGVYIYRFDGQDWTLEEKFIGDEDSSPTFGQSLAAHEDLLFLGDLNDGIGDYSTGAVSIYRYVNDEWVFEQKTYGVDLLGSFQEAWSIATDGDRLIIGNDDYIGPSDHESWVCILHYDGIEWVIEDECTDYALPQEAWYGRAVDIEGSVAVVGSADNGTGLYRGSVYVYRFSGPPNNEWVEEAVLVPADVQDNDFFGEQVVLADENTIIAEAMGHEAPGYGQSTLYVYRYIDQAWALTGKLTGANTADTFGQLGTAFLAAESGKVVTGAPLDDQIGTNAGSAFYYSLSCPADLSGDGFIDQSDLGILLASYAVDAGGDIDGDGDTDQADLGLLLAAYDTDHTFLSCVRYEQAQTDRRSSGVSCCQASAPASSRWR